MIAWTIGRAASGIARACGASKEDAALVGLVAGSAAGLIDPIGVVVNAAHSISQAEAAQGNKLAKKVNFAMSVAALGDGLHNWHKSGTPPTCESSELS